MRNRGKRMLALTLVCAMLAGHTVYAVEAAAAETVETGAEATGTAGTGAEAAETAGTEAAGEKKAEVGNAEAEAAESGADFGDSGAEEADAQAEPEGYSTDEETAETVTEKAETAEAEYASNAAVTKKKTVYVGSPIILMTGYTNVYGTNDYEFVLTGGNSNVCTAELITKTYGYSMTMAYIKLTPQQVGSTTITLRYYEDEDKQTFVDIVDYEITVQGNLPADAVPIKDVVFYSRLVESCDTDENGYVSQSELKSKTQLDFTCYDGWGWEGFSIKDLTGIEYATNLEELYLGGNTELTDITELLSMTTLKAVALDTAVSLADRMKLARVPEIEKLVKGEEKELGEVSGVMGGVTFAVVSGEGCISIPDGFRSIMGLSAGTAAVKLTLGDETVTVKVEVEDFDEDPAVGETFESKIEPVGSDKTFGYGDICIADNLLEQDGTLWEIYPKVKKVDTGVAQYRLCRIYYNGWLDGEFVSYTLDTDHVLWNGETKLAEKVVRFDGRYALTEDGILKDIYAETSDIAGVKDWQWRMNYEDDEYGYKVFTYVLLENGTLLYRNEVKKEDTATSFVEVDDGVSCLGNQYYVKGGSLYRYETNAEAEDMGIEGASELIEDRYENVYGYYTSDEDIYVGVDGVYVKVGNTNNIGEIKDINRESYDGRIFYVVSETGTAYKVSENGSVDQVAENVEKTSGTNSGNKGYIWRFRTLDGKYLDGDGKEISPTEEAPLLIDVNNDIGYSLYLQVDGRTVVKHNGVDVLTSVEALFYNLPANGCCVYALRTDGTLWSLDGVPIQIADLSLDYIRGDVNEDGAVDIKDPHIVLRGITRKDLTKDQEKIAKVTDDGEEVGVQDLRKILLYVCNKIKAL